MSSSMDNIDIIPDESFINDTNDIDIDHNINHLIIKKRIEGHTLPCYSYTKHWSKSPNGEMTLIGDFAFIKCSSLTKITIPSSVTSIGVFAFKECSSLTQITFSIPSSVTSIGNYAFSECTSLAQITIPSSVTLIGDYTFKGYSSLLPDLIQSISNTKSSRNNKSQLLSNINSSINRKPSLVENNSRK